VFKNFERLYSFQIDSNTEVTIYSIRNSEYLHSINKFVLTRFQQSMRHRHPQNSSNIHYTRAQHSYITSTFLTALSRMSNDSNESNPSLWIGLCSILCPRQHIV